MFVFFMFECLLVPLVYFKNIPNFFFATAGLFTTAAYAIIWVIFGLPITLGLAFRDVYYLFTLFRLHRGCRVKKNWVNTLIREEPDP